MPAAPSTQLDIDLSAMPFVVDTSDITDLDDEFALMLLKAQKELDSPTVIETSACNFDVLVPQSLQRSPMWVLWLPEELAGDVEHLAGMPPHVWELTSVDLMKRRATIEWATSTHRICVNVVNVDASLSWAYTNDAPIVIAFVTPSRTALRALPVDADFIMDLSLRGARCDYNYRVLREYSAEELEAAITRSVFCGNEPLFDDQGLKIVHPLGKRYLYDQPRT
jgi:hypothetical protein